MPFKFENLDIPDVVKISPTVFPDERGYFLETYKKSDFLKNGIDLDLIQDNYSFSKKGVVRGIHFQKPPFEQGKLVSVVFGKIFDVAVDIRKGSRTFGKWVGETLSDENHSMLWIPQGFAHGFQAIEDSYVHYKVTAEYNIDAESGYKWNDPVIDIKWPIGNSVVSTKDEGLLLFRTERDLF